MEKLKVNKTSFNLGWLKSNINKLDNVHKEMFNHVPINDIQSAKKILGIYDNSTNDEEKIDFAGYTRESDRDVDGIESINNIIEQETIVKRGNGKRRGDKAAIQAKDIEEKGKENA